VKFESQLLSLKETTFKQAERKTKEGKPGDKAFFQ